METRTYLGLGPIAVLLSFGLVKMFFVGLAYVHDKYAFLESFPLSRCFGRFSVV